MKPINDQPIDALVDPEYRKQIQGLKDVTAALQGEPSSPVIFSTDAESVLNRKMPQAPKIPLALLSSVTVIDSTTTAAQARQWQEELEALYTKHFRNPDPTWTWNDVHDCDRDVLIELEEVIRASKQPPLDLDLVSSFRTSEWRAPYWKQLFSPCAGMVDLSTATLNDIPQAEQVQWQHTKVIQSCDGDLSDADESCLFADWQKAQVFYSPQNVRRPRP